MKETLIDFSKGWSYVDPILHEPVQFTFMGTEDVLEGSSGTDANLFLVFKLIRWLSLGVPDTFQGFEVVITFFWSLMLFFMLCKMKPIISIMEFAFISLSVIVLSVYCFSLAKEPVQMLFFLLMFWILHTSKLSDKQKNVLCILTILLSVVTFRTYYILILLFGFVFQLWMASKSQKRNKKSTPAWITVVGVFIILSLTYLLIMTVLKFAKADLYKRMADSLLYASEATSSSNTYIENAICTNGSNNVILVWLEYTFTVLRMLIPVELFPLGPKYWPYILYQILLTGIVVKAICHYKENTKAQNIALFLLVGFIFTSATFEVDFGAWIRHCAVTFPLILIVSGIILAHHKAAAGLEPACNKQLILMQRR